MRTTILFHGTQPHEKRLDAIYGKGLDRSFPVRPLGKPSVASGQNFSQVACVPDGHGPHNR